jgi:hypothetical protein
MHYLLSFFIPEAHANCPICIVTVGAGLLIAEKLHIDDLLVSIWISGLNTAIAFWMATRFKKRPFTSGIFWAVSFFVVTIAYLWYTRQIGAAFNVMWGTDKIIIGMTAGLTAFLAAMRADKLLRARNGGKVHVPYQKVLMPAVALVVMTIIFKLLI